MRLLIMGPPGAGKGTQAERIKNQLKIAHISTGSLLRKEIRSNSDIGSVAKKLIDKGRIQFIGFPLKIKGGTGSPIRAVAVV